jgi:hypothetical protein
MKIVLLFLCVALAGCGAKSNEDIAKDLIREKLKTTLPDFNNYESVNFGTMGTAYLAFEETDQAISNSKALGIYKDSVALLEKTISESKTAAADNYKVRLQQLQDSMKTISERNNASKQTYIPEKIFKLTHAYIVKDKSGIEKKTEEAFYFDKDFKRIVKVNKIY